MTLRKTSVLRTPEQRQEDLERGLRSVEQGHWGEEQAARFMKRRGWKILERNARPCPRDLRCEIDLIAKTPEGTVVFAEVKTHKRRTAFAPRLAGVDRHKRQILLRACANWLMRHRWHGNFRFDVVEVWGEKGAPDPPEVDHVENVRLFGENWRYW